MSAPENPQAFPHGDETHGGCDGMTLRDWFAGQIMCGMMANGTGGSAFEAAGLKLGIGPDAAMARAAYLMADAMLTARQSQEPPHEG